MPISPTTVINQGDIYFCEPDPADIVGSEQEGDRPWVVMSVPRFHRGNCVVGLPLSRHIEKACAHLVKIPASEQTMESPDDPAIDRVALVDQIRALDKTRFRRKLGFVSTRAISAINLGLDYLFGNVSPPSPPPTSPPKTN